MHAPFPHRIINTHPALLPAFPGWHGVRDALAAGVSETGCTVHLATVEMDAGPILAQQAVPVLVGDTEERSTRGSRWSSALCTRRRWHGRWPSWTPAGRSTGHGGAPTCAEREKEQTRR